MANTKVLLVTGKEDYRDAVEKELVDPVRLWEKAHESAMPQVFQDDEYSFLYNAYMFGDIDPKFIHFLRKIVKLKTEKDFVIL